LCGPTSGLKNFGIGKSPQEKVLKNKVQPPGKSLFLLKSGGEKNRGRGGLEHRHNNKEKGESVSAQKIPSAGKKDEHSQVNWI